MTKKSKKLETTLVKLGEVNARLVASNAYLLRFYDETKARQEREIADQRTTIRVLSRMLNGEVSDEQK